MRKLINQTQTMLEMIRFSHTIFALPFALLAAVLAWTMPTAEGTQIAFRWQDLVGILLCMVAGRSAAMAFNRLSDREIDAANPRTSGRHLPSGQLTVGSVAIFTLFCSAGFVVSTLLFLPNRLPMYLSVPVLLFLLAYSFTKRFTALAHFWLGAALMLAPIATWIALRGSAVTENPLDLLPAIMLGLGVMFWVTGFDIIYACQDYEFDKRTNLKSVPAKMGIAGALRVAAVCHLLMIIVLILMPVVSSRFGLDMGFGWIYYAGVLSVASLLLYEHFLVRPDDLTKVNVAFFNVNAIVSFGLFVVGAIDVFV